MIGNFCYHNPTKLYFGRDAASHLGEELKNYGKTVQLVYGGGSVKRNGIYDEVVGILRACGKNIVEDGGVMPNPTVEKLYEGAKLARENNVDLILAVGGGSVCDYAKAVSVSAYCEGDPWKKYFIDFEEPTCKILPVACVLTMVGTGSEMNGGSVITNHKEKLKIGHVFGSEVMPKFTILNPMYTFSVPKRQMVAGIYDAFNHICEQYFSGEDDNVSDYLSEGLMRALIVNSRVALKDPHDYEARSNIMWAATWALNTLIAQGKDTDWEVHMLGQAVGALTDATHGMTLSAVSLAYYRHILPYVEMSEDEYEDFKAFRDEGKVNDELYNSLSNACEIFLSFLDNVQIEKGQNSVSIDGGVAVQVLSAKHKFEELLQGMQKARTKRNEAGKIDDWYYSRDLEALSRICKG